ncbi:MAG: Ig-like protein [Ignavibacteria bacterium]|nr:Ig-like protein [Ignavibacteria bacterium]
MNKSKLYYLIVFIFINNIGVKAQIPTLPEKLGPTAPYLLSNSNLGTEFWIAIPLADKVGGAALVAMEIQICAIKKTEVTLESGDNFFKTKTVEAFEAITFTSKNNEANVGWEVSESQSNVLKAIHITSKEPIAVYVMNNKLGFADGYMAIPVAAWGMDYYSCSYYDFNRPGGGPFPTIEGSGGFIVIASESQTKLTITLKEKSGAGKTISGSTGGTVLSPLLAAGEVYMVRGDGKKRGLTDFSGTHITANKPIGVISFHTNTMIPSFASEGISPLSEMMVPTSALGTKYISIQYDRQRRIQGNGDFFRFLAIQPNTTIKGKWFDLTTMKTIGQLEPTCKLPGDYYEHNQTDLDQAPPIRDNTAQAVVGSSVFESDKPFYCMQYSYSNIWDGASGWDPDMTLLSPVSQYVPAAIFYVGGLGFNDNGFYLIAQGDPGDPQNNLVRSIQIDDTPIQIFDSKALVNNVPETDYYWDRKALAPGFHKITSNTKLTGFVAGRSSNNAYGWPIIKGTNKLDEPDFEPPVLKKTFASGVFTITATELSSSPTQKDQGISKVIFFSDSSFNLTFNMKDSAKFKPQMKVTSQIFYLTVIDPTKKGVGYYAVLDRAGNYVIDSVLFEPELVAVQTTSDFGKIRVGKPLEKTISIVNNGQTAVNFTKVKLFTGTLFKFKDNPSLPKTLDSKGTFDVTIVYTPNSENKQNPDIDTLTFETDSKSYKSVLSGKGTLPHITVLDHNFGQIKVDSIVCIENVNQKGLKIDNIGTDTLNIISIDNVSPPFYNNTKTPSLPFIIPPGGTVYFKSICFFPKDSGDYSQDIVIHNDAAGDDSSFKLIGQARKKPIVGGIEEFSNKGTLLLIYPNPATEGKVDIEFLSDGINRCRFEFFDISGRCIRSMDINETIPGINKFTYDLSLFDTGIYFIRFSSGGIFIAQKLIVTK